MGKKCHKIPNKFFNQLCYIVCTWLGYTTVLGYIIVQVYCALWTRLSQCLSMAELCTGLTEAAVPGQGQFYCPVWVLLYWISWQCSQDIPGRSREHLQLLSEVCSRLSCGHSTAAELNRVDQARWRENGDHLWMQVNKHIMEPLRDRSP